MKLSNWAQENGISYMTAYRKHKAGLIPGSFKSETGQILVGSPTVIEQKQDAPIMFNNLPATIAMTDVAIASNTRTNRSASIRPTDRLIHLENTPVPFTYSNSNYTEGDVSVRDAVILCQRAYYGFSIFRATIELFTEFCVNNIYFKGGTKRARKFYELFFKKVGLSKLQDMFFRELWRSGNCFIYKFRGKLEGPEFKEMVKLFGGSTSSAEIPIRYILLNPADIQAQGSVTFDQATYQQVLSDYELERLRNPRTPQDKEVLNSLSPEDRKKITDKRGGTVYRSLDAKDIVAVFLNKQSYEALSVPMGYGVLEHLNHKKELELMDQAIARTVQQSILVVTTGAEKDKGGINYKNIENLRLLFQSETVSRTLVADYTTKVEFVIPQIGDILDPKKYEELNASIAIGLGNVFLLQGEKFANQNAKIDIFLQRLFGARRLFLDEFLMPEMKALATQLGFKGQLPEPYYQELDLKNEVEYSKIYVRLMELGLLTPGEGFTAIETGILPSEEDSLESQEKFKQARDKEFYKPLMTKEQEGAGAGRPKGVSAPQSTKKVAPIGASFSLSKIQENMLLAQTLNDKAINILKQKYNLAALNADQLNLVEDIISKVVSNEASAEWTSKLTEYIENPDKQSELFNDIDNLCREHKVNSYLGGILYSSKI